MKIIPLTKIHSGGKPMNENQDKNNLDELGENEPFVKKAAKLSAFIYLALAITVVIVATVGVFSISYDYEESLAEISFPGLDVKPEVSEPKDTLLPIVPDDTPAGTDQSGVDAEVDTRVLYYRPVSGKILKAHNLETLVYSETMKDYRVHSGIDLEAEIGTDVLCFADGVVSAVNDDYFYGTTVVITHDHGLVSYYMNLDPELAEGIAVGSEVLAGEAIGTVGGTARCESADASHLHFELKMDGNPIDPEPELP